VVAGHCQRPATTRPTTLHVCKTRGRYTVASCWIFFVNSMQKVFEVFCMIITCKMHFPLDDTTLNKSEFVYTIYLRKIEEM